MSTNLRSWLERSLWLALICAAIAWGLRSRHVVLTPGQVNDLRESRSVRLDDGTTLEKRRPVR